MPVFPFARPRRALCTTVTSITLALAATAGPSMLFAQGAAPSAALTPADLLDVRTVSVGDYSPDGKWLVVRIARRGDGLGFVAARDGDPSYTRPAPSRLLLLNTATGDTTAVSSSTSTRTRSSARACRCRIRRAGRTASSGC